MAIMAISVAPTVSEGTGVSGYVAKALEVLKQDGRVRWELGPMFTSIEGDFPVLMEVAAKMHEALFEAGAKRVGTVIKIDDRRDRDAHMEDKVRSALSKMSMKQ
ncbi:MAG: MTH1187 family thiamine-binding protein [bacterium]